ncbi:MAG: hypothetical protein U9Q77_12930 [Candidatus Marinimicrobia bacterium]|nr:hypothetical protein [Candidatus Neomarinimicrobiota bacterium]
MEDKKITAEELKAAWTKDIDALAEKVAAAMNSANPGHIIDDSEEPVRDANGEFRQQSYQKAMDLLQSKKLQEDFSPQQKLPHLKWENKGPQKTSCLTVNGPLTITRTIFWNSHQGSVAPVDSLLGIDKEKYSTGVREMASRLNLNEAFIPASGNLLRMAQLSISHSAFRDLVEREGLRAMQAITSSSHAPDWTSHDCTNKTVITGADGVMVPIVTEEQKQKRRATEKARQEKQGKKSTRKRGRPKSGSDGPYKEFKLVSFYDSDKSHKYAVGTSGNHEVLGRIMRREAGKIKIGQAEAAYSVTDGAEWIYRQYKIQLPMLDENILDYFHLRDHVIATSYALYGEGTKKAKEWREDMMGYVWNQGSMVMLDKINNYKRRHKDGPKRESLDELCQYVTKRVDMTDYPSFRQQGYDCGSGPTESFCGCLTTRLKGRGMRWDKDNAEGIMALGSLYYSNQWENYWKNERAA